jgi:hypothetical protein
MSGYLKKPIEDLRINWKLSTTQVKINGLTGMVGLNSLNPDMLSVL